MAEVEDFSLRQSKRRRVDTGLPRNTYGQSQTLARMVNGNGVTDSNQVLRRLLKPSNNQEGVNGDGDRLNGDDSLSASMLNKSKHNGEPEECGGQSENGVGYPNSEDLTDCQVEDDVNLDNKENGEEMSRSQADSDDTEDSVMNGASKSEDKCNGNQSGNNEKPEESVMAKRARVENIVTSMRQSPSQLGSDGKNNQGNETRRQKRKQNAPQPQRVFVQEDKKEGGRKEEKRQLKQLLTQLQDHLNTLQHKYFELYDNEETDSEMEEALDSDGGKLKKGSQSNSKSNKDFRHQHTSGKPPKMCNNDDNVQSKAEDAIVNGGEQERFSDVLKNELTSAVTEVVDSVVKKFVSEQQYNASQASSPSPQDEACNLTIAHENHSQVYMSRMNRSPPHPQYPRVSPTIHQDSMYQSEQTEAIPLVVPHKNRDRPSRENTPRIESQPHHEFEPAVPATLPTSVAIPNPSLQYSLLPHMAVPISDSAGNPEMSMGAIYSSVPMNTMLHSQSAALLAGDSRHPLQGLNHRDLAHAQPEGLPLSLLKPEPLAESSPRSHDYSMDVSSFTSGAHCLSTTLTPAHLKKAKLMFFYARYPSSTVLKQHFPDVKFNRHNTAQLIKWFSNFREFYYIQMEKFARQSLSEGVKNPEMLNVSRDCELFKVLNLHYNKSNEFEVQDIFLIVCRKTLIEFFNAIKAGKDTDASWKKAIYKIISKLDDPLPEFFRSPDCLEELERLER
ncbi:prospero homeobox protein 1-like [Glandiceps talaboti]